MKTLYIECNMGAAGDMLTAALLEETKQYPNFVLSSGCDLPPGVPLENLDAYNRALKEYNSRF